MKRFFTVLLLTLLFTSCAKQSADVLKTDIVDSQPPHVTTVSLTAVGDNLIHNTIYEEAGKRTAGKGFDFMPMYENVRDDIFSADIAFINQEVPLGGTKLGLSSYPTFNAPQELGIDLIKLGFDVVNHGTNHIFDKGEDGVRNTLNFWKSKNIPTLGVSDGATPRVQYIMRNGITFAFVGYVYGTNGLSLPQNSKYSVNLFDKEEIKADIETAKKQADVVIVSMHWGDEYSSTINEQQKDLSALLASLNTDVIIGHHPHVIQPIETIRRADGRDMLIAYSLGNFVSNQDRADAMLGGMLKVEFQKQGDEIRLSQVEFMPLVTHYSAGFKDTKIYHFADYTNALAEKHGCLARDITFSREKLESIIDKTIDAKYIVQWKGE